MKFIVLDAEVDKCGEGLCDVHLWKNIVDIARIISTVLRGLEEEKEKNNTILYKAGSWNAPIVQWICVHLDHYLFTCALGVYLCAEYTRRKNSNTTAKEKKHKSESLLLYAWEHIPEILKRQKREFRLRDFPLEWQGNKKNRKITKTSSCIYEIVNYFRSEYIYKILPGVYTNIHWGPSGIPDWLSIYWTNSKYQLYCTDIQTKKKATTTKKKKKAPKKKRKKKKKKRKRKKRDPVEVKYRKLERFIKNESNKLELTDYLEGMCYYIGAINEKFALPLSHRSKSKKSH